MATRTPEIKATYQSPHDLREEELDTLQWYTQADLNKQENPSGGLLEDGESSAQLEFLVDDRRTVHLNTVDGNLSLLGCQEAGVSGGARQEPEGDARNNDGGGSLDDKKVTPVLKSTAVDMEDAKGDKTREGASD